uniref:Glucuronosyltransferase n=1 Tax=Panagrolaimus sp. ES5 TaxID=591445 RepID=A0AC34FJV9_9BILA
MSNGCVTRNSVFCYGAKILIYNPEYAFARSHRYFLGELSDILADAGHTVVMYQPHFDADTNVTGSKNSKVQILTRASELDLKLPDFVEQIWTAGESIYESEKVMNELHEMFGKNCKNQLKDTTLMEKLKNEKFDLGIAELFDPCGFAVFEKINLKKYITVFTMGLYDSISNLLGIPQATSYVPTGYGGVLPKATFYGRFQNAIGTFITWSTDIYRDIKFSHVIHEAENQHLSVYEKAMNASFIFSNAEEHLDFPRPTSYKVVNIGGFNLNEGQPLDEKFYNMINSASKIVFVSFGSVTHCSLMPQSLKESLFEMFQTFPQYTFLWRHNKPEAENLHGLKNVYLEEWFPQQQILAHPKTVAVITHAGLNSVIEIGYAGVPAIALPIFCDQFKNSLLFEYRGTGIALNKMNVTKTTFVDAFHKIVNKKSYKINAQNLSKMIKSKPMSAKDRVLKYTQFAAEFGEMDNLDLYGRHLNTIHFYNIDVYLFIFGKHKQFV